MTDRRYSNQFGDIFSAEPQNMKNLFIRLVHLPIAALFSSSPVGLSFGAVETCDGMLNFTLNAEGECVNLDQILERYSNQEDTYDIGVLDINPLPKKFSGIVNSKYQIDQYKFSLQAKSNFKLLLDQLSADANVSLINAEGVTIWYSQKIGTSSESADLTLNPGSYSLKVNLNDENGTSYSLILQAKFVTSVASMDTGNRQMPDPEFDQVGFQVTWQDEEENLWVMPINSVNGDFVATQAVQLATGLAPNAPLSSGLATGNGPEWVYTQSGSQILYTWQNPDEEPSPASWRVGRAYLEGVEWNAGVLPPGIVGGAPGGSKTLEDTAPLINYYYYLDNNGKRVSAWRDLYSSVQGKAIPFELKSGVRWVAGERAFVSTVTSGKVDQVVMFNVDTEVLTQLTFDTNLTKWKPQMWRAPELNNQLVFFALESEPSTRNKPTQIGIYQNNQGTWSKIKTIDPPSNLPLIDSPEYFVHNNKSYLVFSTVSESGQSEVWIAGIDPNQDFYRQVSDPEVKVASTDAEPFITQVGAFIYYAQAGGRYVFRADTGLGPSVEASTF
ncbi:MAG TPA: hypothetical protein V6D29_07770 [Leptolyngbyaceae cyanobacterium]